MENRNQAGGGICIVSFDGGGPGSISQLRILDEFMLRLAFNPVVEVEELHPSDYFDLMGGVGFGGLVALMLGRLRMTTSQAMEELATIGTETFPIGDDMVTPEVNMTRLRQSIESMLERHGHSVDIKLRDSSDNRCKVVLFAATTKTMNHPHPFRTYRSRQGCLDCTFVDAACATLAIPEYFSSVAIGPRLRAQHFAGIPHGFDNPMRKVLKEAQLTFGEQKPVSLVLSLGSGPRPRLSDPDHHATRLCHIRCDGVASDLQDQLHGVGQYLRLNVDREMEAIELDAWHELGSIESYTNVYLEMSLVTNYIDRASQWLLQRSRSITLGQLSGTSTGSAVTSHSETLKDYLKMELKQMHNVIQDLGIERITLVDAIGNHIPIPLQFCLSYNMLSDVIRVYFIHQKAPGVDFVERGDYRLVQGTRKSIVGPMEWGRIEKAGLKVEMSIVLRTRNEDKSTCPGCFTRFEGCTVDGWAQCSSCSGQFQTETRVQVEARIRSPDITRFGAEDLIESNKVAPEAREPKSGGLQVEHKSNEEPVQLPFRLISVIKLIRGMSRQSGSPPTGNRQASAPATLASLLSVQPPLPYPYPAPHDSYASQAFTESSSNPSVAHRMVLDDVLHSGWVHNQDLEPSMADAYSRDLYRRVAHLSNRPAFDFSNSKTPFLKVFVENSGGRHCCLICDKPKDTIPGALSCIRAHLQLKPFQCQGCQSCNQMKGFATFWNAALLRAHVYGQRTVTCTECGKQLRQINLRRHMFMIHKDVEELLDFLIDGESD